MGKKVRHTSPLCGAKGFSTRNLIEMSVDEMSLYFLAGFWGCCVASPLAATTRLEPLSQGDPSLTLLLLFLLFLRFLSFSCPSFSSPNFIPPPVRTPWQRFAPRTAMK